MSANIKNTNTPKSTQSKAVSAAQPSKAGATPARVKTLDLTQGVKPNVEVQGASIIHFTPTNEGYCEIVFTTPDNRRYRAQASPRVRWAGKMHTPLNLPLNTKGERWVCTLQPSENEFPKKQSFFKELV